MTKQGWEKKLSKLMAMEIATIAKLETNENLRRMARYRSKDIENFISQELSTFAEEVEERALKLDKGYRGSDEWGAGYCEAIDDVMGALTKLKKEKGI